MQTHADKSQEDQSISTPARAGNEQKQDAPTFQFVDNRPEAIQMRKSQEMASNHAEKNSFQFVDNRPEITQMKRLQELSNNDPQNPQLHTAKQERLVQKKSNDTGLPDNLKSGIENRAGYSMDDVKVHYNSDKPAQLNAHAYAQGTDIHIASGQEKHLPHEAWHVVQQKQGRVKPTVHMKADVSINDDAGLEKEADMMGAKLANSSKHAGPGEAATLNHTAKTSQVIQGVFVQNNQTTSLWTDTDTGKVYQQTSVMTGNRIALTAQDGESFIIALGVDGTWNRVDQQGQITLTPKKEGGYRVHAEFKGFNTVDTLRSQGLLPKEDLPYSAHGTIRDQEFRDFFSDIPSLPKDQQPSQEYLKLLDERIRAYSTLAQPKPPEEDLHKRPWKQNQDYNFSFDTSSLPFHQADDLVKSSYQRKDKSEKNLTVQDLYEAQYLSNFNRIVPESALYAPFTQTQQTGHWLTTLGPTLDVNFPPTITDKSAGTDYKGVYTVFKNFLARQSNNPDFIKKTVEDTQLFLGQDVKDMAIEAHKEAYLASSNKKNSKSAGDEGKKSIKRKNLSVKERENIEHAHTNIVSFLSGGNPQFPTTPNARNVQKIAYLFYIKLVRRTITNVIMLMNSNIGDLGQIMDTLLDRLTRLAALQSKLYDGSNDQTSDGDDDDDVYQPYIPQEVQLLAQQNGVQARYGGSHGNNCLIYAIAGALGVNLSDQEATNIRNWLNSNSAQSGHFTPYGQLPMLPGLIQEITNQLQQGHQINGNITVVTTGGNFHAQGAVANNANNGNVLVILHGGHYYFTQ